MKRIIDISEEDYNFLIEHKDEYNYEHTRIAPILNSTPLNECEAEDYISRADVNRIICEYRDDAVMGDLKDVERAYGANAVGELIAELPSVYPKSDKPYDVVINYCAEHGQIIIDKDKYESLQQLRKANNQLKKQIEMLKLDRDCDKSSRNSDNKDYIIREDAFMALTGDITDCTIEEFISRLRDKLSKLPSARVEAENCRSLKDIKEMIERKANALDGQMLDAGGVCIGLYFSIANDLPSVYPKSDKPVFTLEELELLDQCLSKHFYSINGMPDIVVSCAVKIQKLKEQT